LALTHRERVRIRGSLAVTLAVWLALFAIGLLRSPNFGGALAMAGEAGLYALMLLCGIILSQLEPMIVGTIFRAIVAMCSVEALAGVWQRLIDIPTIHKAVSTGEVDLPEQLRSGLGVARIQGNLAWGSFQNPNSLAGYLLIGMFLLAGLLLRRSD